MSEIWDGGGGSVPVSVEHGMGGGSVPVSVEHGMGGGSVPV